MKKFGFRIMLAATLWMAYPGQSHAAVPWLVVIKEASKKVIKAIDLKVQRLQNKTIWLQNAQKTLENTLSKLNLDKISDWAGKQKEQYRKYYEELAKVKGFITSYQRIRDISKKQWQLLDEYKRARSLIQRDRQFTDNEREYMEKVYTGILKESVNNMDQINLIKKSFLTRMSDAERMELINQAADRIEINYSDLVRFNRQNTVLSLQRARAEREVQTVKKLYGLP